MSIKIHNATWPGVVGKGEPGTEPAIGLEEMLDLTAEAQVDSSGYDGVDLFLFQPHMDVFDDADIQRVAEEVQKRDLKIGSFVAPVWDGTVGASAMGSEEDRKKFLKAVEISCQVGQRFKELGVRSYGCVRIDSATPTAEWAKAPEAGTQRIAATFKEAAQIAKDHGERLAAEGEICWGSMHSWKYMLQLLETVGEPEALGFQADLAHTYLYLLGVNAPEHQLIARDHDEAAFNEAYQIMVKALGPWLFDFHVAQSNGTVFGSGSHDKTGRHCPADASDGKLDIVECSLAWLLDDKGQIRNGIEHICWDGCMFPNETLEKQETWNTILDTMFKVRAAVGG